MNKWNKGVNPDDRVEAVSVSSLFEPFMENGQRKVTLSGLQWGNSRYHFELEESLEREL